MDPVIVSKIKKNRNIVKLELADRDFEKTSVSGNSTLKSKAKTLTVLEGIHRRIE